MRKYEDSLKQIEILIHENELLKSNLSKVRDYQQMINSKNLEVEELQRRLNDLSSARSFENQRNEAYYKLEIEYKKLEFENKRIKEINDSKNKEIEELTSKSKQLIYQFEETSSQLKQFSNINHTIKEYENRFALLGQ
jgi:hypothetical protein